MTEAQSTQFLAQLDTLCRQAGAFSEVTFKNRPKLEHIRIEINVKVEGPDIKSLDNQDG